MIYFCKQLKITFSDMFLQVYWVWWRSPIPTSWRFGLLCCKVYSEGGLPHQLLHGKLTTQGISYLNAGIDHEYNIYKSDNFFDFSVSWWNELWQDSRWSIYCHQLWLWCTSWWIWYAFKFKIQYLFIIFVKWVFYFNIACSHAWRLLIFCWQCPSKFE